jgi:hypothetical protein
MARALELLKKYTGWAKLEASMEKDFQRKRSRSIVETRQRCQTFENIVWEAIALEQAAEDPDMQDGSRGHLYWEALEKHRYFWDAKRADRPPTTAEDAAYKIEAMFLAQQGEAEHKLFEAKIQATLFGLVILAPIVVSIYLVAKAIITQL